MNRYVIVLLALAMLFPAMALAATNRSSHDAVQRHHSHAVVVSDITVPTHAVVVRQFHHKRISELQAGVQHYRAIARHRAAELGVTIKPRPLPNNIVWLMQRRLIWKHKAAHYAARLRAVARQKAAAAKAAREQAAAAASAPAPAAPTSSSGLIADFNCISEHEEYGVTGQNTSAGYFGMIYPPSAYPSPGPEYAAQYGDSWLDIPLSAQYQIAIAEQAKYGWSPWSTAPMCGL